MTTRFIVSMWSSMLRRHKPLPLWKRVGTDEVTRVTDLQRLLTLWGARVFCLILPPTIGISTYGQFWLTKSDYYIGSEFSMLGAHFEQYLALATGRACLF